MSVEEVEKLGRNLTNGFGLWGTIDSLKRMDGWTEAKSHALIQGWIDGCNSLGLTEIDAAVLGDYKLGRWLVDNASFWADETPGRIRANARNSAKEMIEEMLRENKRLDISPTTVRELKTELVREYTDWYPVTYATRFGRE
jgi:hypothetical protein